MSRSLGSSILAAGEEGELDQMQQSDPPVTAGCIADFFVLFFFYLLYSWCSGQLKKTRTLVGMLYLLHASVEWWGR